MQQQHKEDVLCRAGTRLERYSQAMDFAVPAPAPPAATIDEVIARMRSIDAALPSSDGVACFNQMYLEVTLGSRGSERTCRRCDCFSSCR